MDGDDLAILAKSARPFSRECADALHQFAYNLKDKQDGEAVQVPDFEALYSISLYDVLAQAAGVTGVLRDDRQWRPRR
jgi:hypothetical protein